MMIKKPKKIKVKIKSKRKSNILQKDLANIKINKAKSLSEFVDFDFSFANSIFKNKLNKSKLKDFFIPHVGNGHAPHILQPKRAIFYSSVFLLTKLTVFLTIMLLPLQAYLLPDVLIEQEQELNKLIYELRIQNNLSTLSLQENLEKSAQIKANDMAKNGYFSHISPDNHNFKYFLTKGNYKYKLAGENLAMGFISAQDVMDAWVKSPLHYQNLIDPDFVEMGIGLNSGKYKKRDTIFIANHFGKPLFYDESKYSLVNKTNKVKKEQNNIQVLGQKFSFEDNERKDVDIIYDKSLSNVYWRYDGRQTKLLAQAFITGDIKKVFVTVDGEKINLKLKDLKKGLYQGELTTDKNINEFFNVIITPSITIETNQGISLIDNIDWYEVKIVNKTPTQSYINAHKILPNILWPLFNTERAIYIFGLIFFTTALIINILIEVKTQRPHVIIPTVLVIALLIVLMFV